jgi:hypothetical protein
MFRKINEISRISEMKSMEECMGGIQKGPIKRVRFENRSEDRGNRGSIGKTKFGNIEIWEGKALLNIEGKIEKD